MRSLPDGIATPVFEAAGVDKKGLVARKVARRRRLQKLFGKVEND